LTIISYNIQGFNSRSLEVLDLIHQVEVAVVIFTEVRELYATKHIPDFNTFYEEGTNKN